MNQVVSTQPVNTSPAALTSSRPHCWPAGSASDTAVDTTRELGIGWREAANRPGADAPSGVCCATRLAQLEAPYE
jgi:hypothetical protein